MSDYQVTVTLHAVDDREYGEFVIKLLKELFGVPVGIHRGKRAAVFNYVISRIELVRFLEKLGLKQGNKVRGKEYLYKKLLFTSHSEPLRQSAFTILSSLGIKARLDNGYDVRIDSREDMPKYFQIVGSHNPKHLKKYKN